MQVDKTTCKSTVTYTLKVNWAQKCSTELENICINRMCIAMRVEGGGGVHSAHCYKQEN